MQRHLILPMLLILLTPISTQAIDLASAPLAGSSSSVAKPNLMLLLDDSNSMRMDYMPDWVGSPFCWSDTDTSHKAPCGGLPHFDSSDFNKLYYNPAIRYLPAKNADGSSMPSLDNEEAWKAVSYDAYRTTDFRYNNFLTLDKARIAGKIIDATTFRKAYYYTLQAGEYCNSKKLDQCIITAKPKGAFVHPAKVRFCDSLSTALSADNPANGACQATIDSTHILTNIRVVGRGGYYCNKDKLEDCVKSEKPVDKVVNGKKISYTVPDRSPAPGAFIKTDIVSGNTYPKTANRSDCAASYCTYDEEMTNFANWFSYYRTRLQLMKTATSLAFDSIDDRYRVGYSVINYDGVDKNATNRKSPNKFLPIDTFNQAHKQDFYDRLFKAQIAYNDSIKYDGESTFTIYKDPLHFSPLRGALARAGKIYAHKISGISDPIQHACQANFTILSTDAYWNGAESQVAGKDQPETSTFGPYGLDGAKVGDLDSGDTVPLEQRDTLAAKNTLADVAKYYYDTDLRTSKLNNCINADNVNVCGASDSKLKQNMSTFTVGLGVDGILLYSNDYKTANSGDYYDIKNGLGTAKWPDPITCFNPIYCEERIDDLWHAAVNANGSYYSGGDAKQLVESLSAALAEIYARSNAGGAAATSSLTPVTGNNNAYVASYTSMEWNGNLESRSIDTASGQTSKSANWCVEDVAEQACPASIYKSDSNGNKRTYCAPAGTTTFTAAMEISSACSGNLKTKFPSSSSDSRQIYTNVDGTLKNFTYSNLNSIQKSYFQSTYLMNAKLSQWSVLTASQKLLAKEGNLINYLRGQTVYENRDSNTPANRLFRYREKTLGDITESNAVYVPAPNFNYLESSYAAFKDAQAGRTKSLYVGANDGMLHAFNATDGSERWAYIPSMLLSKLWNLADNNYATQHKNFVNGSTTVTDICNSLCSTESDWKTILVGGLGEGGKGFYALNVSNDQPSLLWEFDNQDDVDLGFSYGNPVITKQRDGTWVVLLTSGYNNTGMGYLYVLNANTGALLRKISTQVGTADNPSGLAKISAFVARPSENNQADYVYGGDLLGNLWRFKFDSAGSTTDAKNPLLLASLTGPTSKPQAITTRPELGKISGHTVVFIGTGKYLGQSDLATAEPQTLYAIKDTASTISRSDLSSRSIKNASTGSSRTGVVQAEVFTSGHGWYIDLPDQGERQVVAAKLASGTLVVPTMVPSTTACSPNGYGWVNYFQAKTGGLVTTNIANPVGTKTSAAPAGINLLYINGKPTISYTADNDPTPQLDPNAPFNSGSGFAGKRASWRELIP